MTDTVFCYSIPECFLLEMCFFDKLKSVLLSRELDSGIKSLRSFCAAIREKNIVGDHISQLEKLKLGIYQGLPANLFICFRNGKAAKTGNKGNTGRIILLLEQPHITLEY